MGDAKVSRTRGSGPRPMRAEGLAEPLGKDDGRARTTVIGQGGGRRIKRLGARVRSRNPKGCGARFLRSAFDQRVKRLWRASVLLRLRSGAPSGRPCAPNVSDWLHSHARPGGRRQPHRSRHYLERRLRRPGGWTVASSTPTSNALENLTSSSTSTEGIDRCEAAA